MDKQAESLLECAWKTMMQRDPDRAGERNEIGWNGGDSRWAHRISRFNFRFWRDDMVDELVEKLGLYRGQLQAAGIDYDRLVQEHRQGLYYRSAKTPQQRGEFEPARVKGVCARCRRDIVPGQLIKLLRAHDNRGWERLHKECVQAVVSTPIASSAPAAPHVRQPAPSPAAPAVRHTPAPPRTASVVTMPPVLETVAPFVGAPRTVLQAIGPGGSIAKALPNYEARPQQVQMAQIIEEQLGKGRRPTFDEADNGEVVQGGFTFAHVVAEMPTGTGKSFGYVVPSVLSRKKVIVSTAVKALQEQLLEKDLPFLAKHLGVPFTYAIAKGRANYLCLHAKAQSDMEIQAGNAVFRSPEDADAYKAVDEWAGSETCEKTNGDLESVGIMVPGAVRELITVTSDDCLGRKCPVYEQCYVERQKAIVKDADIVVANHALLVIDAKVRDSSDGYASVLPQADAVMVDEAHRLEDVARNQMGEELTELRLGRIIRRLERLTTKNKAVRGDMERMGSAQEWVLFAGESLVPYSEIFTTIKRRLEDAETTQQVLGNEEALIQPTITKLVALSKRMRGHSTDAGEYAAPEWLEGAEREQWTKVADSIDALAGALSTLASPEDPDKWCRYAELDNRARRVTLHCKPVDVSHEIRSMLLSRFPTVVMTSATLAIGKDFSQFRERIGMTNTDEVAFDVAELVSDSPFDYQANSVLYVPDDLPDPRARQPHEKERYFDALSQRLVDLIVAGQCNTFCLFTSFTAMREVYDRVWQRLPGHFRAYVQGELPRSQIVDAFKDETTLRDEPKVLFATRTFFEGVDLQGQFLELVIIDKIPFPAAGDPLYRAFCDLIERRYGQGSSFARVALPEAITTLKQANGRLIRTKSDKGVCAILDPRVATASYGRRIVASLPPMRRTQNMATVRAFFAQMHQERH